MEKTKMPGVKATIIKADVPVQIDREENMLSSEWIEPPLPMDNLKEMVRNSIILPQCIRAYKNNIAGYGIAVKYISDDQEETSESKAEWDMLEGIVDLFTTEQDTKEIFEDIIEAREAYGIAYCEVIRDLHGNVVQLEMIRDTASIRKTKPLDYGEYIYNYRGISVKRKKRFRKYKQEVSGETVYFKEFGDMRHMDLRDGRYYDGVELRYQANEIIEFPIGTEAYGEVRWIGHILGCDGARRAEYLNNNYFVNGRHTPLMICIKGGTLTEASTNNLRRYMNEIKGSNGQHAFLLLEAESIDTDFEAKQPEVEVKDLASILQKDELFQEYIENNRKRVQSAFNLPDLYVGYTKDFNRATAQTAMEVTEKQVFQPERTSMAWTINNKLLNGYDLKYCEVEFRSPEITNPDDLYKILTIAEKAGGLPPNKAKQIAYSAIGEISDDYDGEWGDVPVTIASQIQKAQVDKQLDTQIKKAENNDEPTELVAVMKEVRRLLVDIQKEE